MSLFWNFRPGACRALPGMIQWWYMYTSRYNRDPPLYMADISLGMEVMDYSRINQARLFIGLPNEIVINYDNRWYHAINIYQSITFFLDTGSQLQWLPGYDVKNASPQLMVCSINHGFTAAPFFPCRWGQLHLQWLRFAGVTLDQAAKIGGLHAAKMEVFQSHWGTPGYHPF